MHPDTRIPFELGGVRPPSDGSLSHSETASFGVRRRIGHSLYRKTVRVPPAPPTTPVDDGPPVDELFIATYGELRRLARARLRDGGRNTVLDTTALVHETYLRLSKALHVPLPDRPRFFVYASRVMRSVIVDLVRQRRAERRGGDAVHVTLTGDLHEHLHHRDSAAARDEILHVHEALEALARVDERMAQVVEMRYFGGLTDLEIGEALGVTDRTVRRDWEQARLFLADALK
jgi:RNA polymerase sigma factor (TIGR02999 family)